MDNGTMVETFKHLNYCQLAKNSLVSKRFRNLIQTHRHKLALLYVDSIGMYSIKSDPSPITVFEKVLSPEAYNQWIICNNYLKQIPIKNQAVNEENTQITNRYRLAAYANYEDSSHREWNDKTTVFSAHVQFNHENWPLFQHFVHLITDPFIYIDRVQLIDQNDVLNLLTRAINSDHNYLQCNQLVFTLRGNSQKSITWIKNYALCDKLYIFGQSDLNQDEAFFDFFVTGANCAPSINIGCRDLSKGVTDFLEKFMNLKTSETVSLLKPLMGLTRALMALTP